MKIKHGFAKLFLLFNLVVSIMVFYHHQKYTITWGDVMPASFTSTQIVAELWSAEAVLEMLLCMIAYDLLLVLEESSDSKQTSPDISIHLKGGSQ